MHVSFPQCFSGFIVVVLEAVSILCDHGKPGVHSPR